MRWLPIAWSNGAYADSIIRYHYLFLIWRLSIGPILFGLKLGWCFRHLWICSNKNKGGRRYHISSTKIYIDVVVRRWLGSLYPRPIIRNKPKRGACALSTRLFIPSIHGYDTRFAAPHPSTRETHIWRMRIECWNL